VEEKMRKKKAQKIRKEIYGDMAFREPGWPKIVSITKKDSKRVYYQAQASPLKKAYRKAKRKP
jgi:hypothetical protein